MATATQKVEGAVDFEARLAAVPRSPGVYVMKDGRGKVLYVGKSVSLRNRLRSYFGSPKKLRGKVRDLVRRIRDFEYIVAESEREALLLENSLIKEHMPRYNAHLKDDKSYPYIKVDLNDDFPRIYFTRRHYNDGARYFGPYASARSVRRTLNLLKKLFPYRTCTKKITGTDERPCLEYYIKRCVAPCTGQASQEDYGAVVEQVVAFLDGDTDSVVRQLQSDMADAAEDLEFERAATLRDRLAAMKIVYEDQKVVGIGKEDFDVLAVAQGQNECIVDVFFVRQGNMVGRDNYVMAGTWDDTDGHVLAKFVEQFYLMSNPHLPRTVLTHADVEDADILEELLSEKRDGRFEIRVPQRGAKRKLVEMAQQNAEQGLRQLKIKWQSNSDLMANAVDELQDALSLPSRPERIECYDVSHTQGSSTVASMSVFINGSPDTSKYRKFRIKTVDGNDDFASMREVLTRRFKRLADVRRAEIADAATDADGAANGAVTPDAGVDATANGDVGHAVEGLGDAESDATMDAEPNDEGSARPARPRKLDPSFSETPDLVLIDGGKGQLSAALETMLHMGAVDIPIASIAKREEEVFVPDASESIRLDRSSPALFLLQQVRDEAHRFAITYHRNERGRTSLRSALDLVPGIGPTRKRALIRRFGSVKAVREATELELASTPGMTSRLAARLKEYL